MFFIYITPKEQELSGKLNEGEHAKIHLYKNSNVSLKWQKYWFFMFHKIINDRLNYIHLWNTFEIHVNTNVKFPFNILSLYLSFSIYLSPLSVKFLIWYLCTMYIPGGCNSQKKPSDFQKHRWLLADMRVLGIEPRSYRRAASTFNCQTISRAPIFFLFETSLYCIVLADMEHTSLKIAIILLPQPLDFSYSYSRCWGRVIVLAQF